MSTQRDTSATKNRWNLVCPCCGDVVPIDEGDSHGGDQDSGDEQGDDQQGQEQGESGGESGESGESGDESGEPGDGQGQPGNGPSNPGTAGGSGAGQRQEVTDEEIEDAYRESVIQEAGGTGEERTDEAEEWHRIVTDAHEDEGRMLDIEFLDADERARQPDPGTKTAAQRIAQRVKQTLGQALEHEQRARVVRKQRRGTFSARDYVTDAAGVGTAFRHKDEGKEKDYAVMLILDRSGSMAGQIEDAEAAVGGFADALEDLGVEVCIMDFVRNHSRVIKPFGVAVREEEGVLYSGKVGGSTPLTTATGLARRRLERHPANHKFMIVLSDGGPDSPEAFIEEVGRCRFPVLGIYLAEDYTRDFDPADEWEAHQREYIATQLRSFHRGIAVYKGEDLLTALDNLARAIML